MSFWPNLFANALSGLKSTASDPLAWLGAAGTGLGIYDIFRRQKAESDYLRRQRDWQRQVASVANAPLNIEAIFNPGKDLIQRDIEAGLGERGLQPGGAYTNAISEGMMRHWLNAANVAQAQRASQLGALTGTGGPARPNFPGMGDVSALGKYLQYRRESKAAEQARGQQADYQTQLLEAIRSMGGGGQQPQDFYSGMPTMVGDEPLYGGEAY